MAQQHPYGHLRALYYNDDEDFGRRHHEDAWAKSPKRGGGIDWPTAAMYTVALTLDALIIFGVVKLLRKRFS